MKTFTLTKEQIDCTLRALKLNVDLCSQALASIADRIKDESNVREMESLDETASQISLELSAATEVMKVINS